MHCVNCGEDMVVLELERVEVDHCMSCGGVWLDQGELGLILHGAAGVGKLMGSFVPDPLSREKKRKCPVCRKAMEKAACGSGERVILDKCGKGHGFWFDKGELSSVLRIGCLGDDRRVADLLKGIFGGK